MRVALVVASFPQISETFIVAKAAGLLHRGIDVHIICRRSPADAWSSYSNVPNIEQLRARVHIAPPLGGPGGSVVPVVQSLTGMRSTSLPALRRYFSRSTGSARRRLVDVATDAPLLRLAPDVVHFEFGTQAVGRMGIGARLDSAVTVSFRGYDLNYAGLDDPNFYREVWARADGIHVLGDDLWQRALRRGAPSGLRHTVITPAIDTTRIVPVPVRSSYLGCSDVPLRVLSVGRLHWKKGYDYALDAIAELGRRGISVEHRIVGDGEFLDAVAYWRRQLRLESAVELLRTRPPAEITHHLGWADVMLHAATSEGYCNAVLEAQAHGVPVVSSDADGLGENVQHGITGFVVPRRDPFALANAMEALANDADLRLAMSVAGRERAATQFRIEDHIDAWIRFFSDAVAGRSGISQAASL